jgi:hypothetical protein
VVFLVAEKPPLPLALYFAFFLFGTVLSGALMAGIYFGFRWGFIVNALYTIYVYVVSPFMWADRPRWSFLHVVVYFVDFAILGYCVWRLVKWDRLKQLPTSEAPPIN